ncbi:hypothetical protein [Amycolatopsis magusensis]|uniref:hypothetical protein n=1 Tax=Amycolatopsis magusensis TaxID=882444 RepID=UPI0037A2BA26
MPDPVSTLPTAPPSTTTDARDRYHQFRREGLPAAHAYRCATAAAARTVRYRSGPREAITLLLDDRPELAGFTATATADHNEDPDLFGLGEFSDIRTEDTVPVYLSAEIRYEYFQPSYTLAQRRADLARHGYARGPAHELALRQVREDARLARQLEARYVRVEVRKAGVLLGDVGIGITFIPGDDPDAALAEHIGEYGLLDEAIAQARAALPPLLAALAA